MSITIYIINSHIYAYCFLAVRDDVITGICHKADIIQKLNEAISFDYPALYRHRQEQANQMQYTWHNEYCSDAGSTGRALHLICSGSAAQQLRVPGNCFKLSAAIIMWVFTLAVARGAYFFIKWDACSKQDMSLRGSNPLLDPGVHSTELPQPIQVISWFLQSVW